MLTMDQALQAAMNIKGAFAVALVDYDSGMTLGEMGGNPKFDLEVAAPGNSEVVRTKLDVVKKLGLTDGIEDVLITLDTQYHLIRLLRSVQDESLFFYLALSRQQANLALARRDLRIIEQELVLGRPGAGGAVGAPGGMGDTSWFPPESPGR